LASQTTSRSGTPSQSPIPKGVSMLLQVITFRYRTARVSKVSFAAADQGTNAQYTRLMANMRAAQAAMAGLERDNRKFSSDLKVLWTEAGKAR